MKKIFPIVLIWLTVSTALFELLAQLGFILIDLKTFLEWFVVVCFILSILTVRKQFAEDSHIVLREIEAWEPDMREDIAEFIKARKSRLLMSVSIVWVLLVLKFAGAYLQPKYKEPLLYVFVIGLFHVSLVASLILFKISRTISWIRHENNLARQEQS